jgi:hypothetical protein
MKPEVFLMNLLVLLIPVVYLLVALVVAGVVNRRMQGSGVEAFLYGIFWLPLGFSWAVLAVLGWIARLWRGKRF